jgi:pimeloyl-ACP methyl ester carboxylesterase
MGGAITIEFALTYPTIAKSIVLVATGAKLRVSPLILDGLRNEPESAFRTILDWSFWAAESAPKNEFERILRATPLDVTIRDYMACDRFDRMADIEAIACRCLAICGSEDRMTPPKFSQYLVKQVRKSVLALVPNAGHMVMMEEPARFNDVVRIFLVSG